MSPDDVVAFRMMCLDRYYDDGENLRVRQQYSRNVKVGHLAGFVHVSGYREVRIGFSQYKAHRVLWLMRLGEWPHGELDHVNGIRADNRQENLRVASRSQNMRNVNAYKGRLYKGVYVCRSLWRARIMLRGVMYELGLHKTPGEAALAYDKAARKLHGEFAKLNFPGLEM